MEYLIWGITLGTIGKLVLGIAVLRVHVYIIREHKIDNVVLQALKREQLVTLFGLALIIIGYAIEMLFYYQSTHLITCDGMDCVFSLFSSF